MLDSNNQKGVIAQLKTELVATELGIIVSKPVVESVRYDLVFDMRGSLYRVQVKWAGTKDTRRTGTTRVDLRRTSTSGKNRPVYTTKEIDLLAAYVPDVDEVCIFPATMIDGKQSLSIRFLEAKNGHTKNVFWYEDFLLRDWVKHGSF